MTPKPTGWNPIFSSTSFLSPYLLTFTSYHPPPGTPWSGCNCLLSTPREISSSFPPQASVLPESTPDSSSPSVLSLDQTFSGRPSLTSLKETACPALVAFPLPSFCFLPSVLSLTYFHVDPFVVSLRGLAGALLCSLVYSKCLEWNLTLKGLNIYLQNCLDKQCFESSGNYLVIAHGTNGMGSPSSSTTCLDSLPGRKTPAGFGH